MNWHTRRLLLLDFETSGVDPHRDRIVTGAAIGVGGDQPTNVRDYLINPGIPIPAGATEIHGVTDEQAAQGTDPAVTVLEIANLIMQSSRAKVPVVGHNVVYDLTMLWAELTRYGHESVANWLAGVRPVVDTKIVEHHLDPFRPKLPKPWTKRPDEACGSHQLTECCRLWGIELSAEDAHGAAADALAAGRLAWRLATDHLRFARFDSKPTERVDVAAMSLDDLHEWQVGQYAERALSFQSYMRGEQRGKPDEVDPGFVANTQWPVQSPPAGWSPADLPVVAEAVSA